MPEFLGKGVLEGCTRRVRSSVTCVPFPTSLSLRIKKGVLVIPEARDGSTRSSTHHMEARVWPRFVISNVSLPLYSNLIYTLQCTDCP